MDYISGLKKASTRPQLLLLPATTLESQAPRPRERRIPEHEPVIEKHLLYPGIMSETPATSSAPHPQDRPGSPGEQPASQVLGQRDEGPACTDTGERADERMESRPEATNLATDDEESRGQESVPAGLIRACEEAGGVVPFVAFVIMLWWFRRQMRMQ